MREKLRIIFIAYISAASILACGPTKGEEYQLQQKHYLVTQLIKNLVLGSEQPSLLPIKICIQNERLDDPIWQQTTPEKIVADAYQRWIVELADLLPKSALVPEFSCDDPVIYVAFPNLLGRSYHTVDEGKVQRIIAYRGFDESLEGVPFSRGMRTYSLTKLINLLTHEFGHAFGLNDLYREINSDSSIQPGQDSLAVMFRQNSCGDNQVCELAEDDHIGALESLSRALYIPSAEVLERSEKDLRVLKKILLARVRMHRSIELRSLGFPTLESACSSALYKRLYTMFMDTDSLDKSSHFTEREIRVLRQKTAIKPLIGRLPYDTERIIIRPNDVPLGYKDAPRTIFYNVVSLSKAEQLQPPILPMSRELRGSLAHVVWEDVEGKNALGCQLPSKTEIRLQLASLIEDEPLNKWDRERKLGQGLARKLGCGSYHLLYLTMHRSLLSDKPIEHKWAWMSGWRDECPWLDVDAAQDVVHMADFEHSLNITDSEYFQISSGRMRSYGLPWPDNSESKNHPTIKTIKSIFRQRTYTQSFAKFVTGIWQDYDDIFELKYDRKNDLYLAKITSKGVTREHYFLPDGFFGGGSYSDRTRQSINLQVTAKSRISDDKILCLKFLPKSAPPTSVVVSEGSDKDCLTNLNGQTFIKNKQDKT